MECSTSRISFTATVHLRRTTCGSVTYSPCVRQYGTRDDPRENPTPTLSLSAIWVIFVTQCPFKIARCCWYHDAGHAWLRFEHSTSRSDLRCQAAPGDRRTVAGPRNQRENQPHCRKPFGSGEW